MDVVVFESASGDADCPADTSLTFRRLVERGVIDAANAEIFSDMSPTPPIVSTIVEVTIQYILQYVSPIRGDGIYITVSAFMAPYGVSDGIMMCGFLGVPMKPRQSMVPGASDMDRYVPYRATAYTLDDADALAAFFKHRMPVIEACVRYDAPDATYLQNPTTHVRADAVSADRIRIRQTALHFGVLIASVGSDMQKHLALIRHANEQYVMQDIRYKMLTSYARKRYNMVWSELDRAKQDVLLFELAKKEAELQKQRENKCGHKSLLQALVATIDGNSRGVRTDYVIKTHAALSDYYAPMAPDDTNITCNNCTYVIMCRHFEMMCKTRSVSAVAKMYGDAVGAVFYCRLCGEYLTYNTTLLESLDLGGHDMYHHTDMLSKQVHRILIHYLYQYTIPHMRNFTEIVYACIDIILPRIRNKLTIKYVKFFNLDKVEKYTQLVISVYSAAVIVRLIMQYPDIMLRTVLDIPDTESGREAGYLEYFYNNLTKVQYVNITAVMTFEEFGNMLYLAYKTINVVIEISDATVDTCTYNNMCVCGYVRYATQSADPVLFADVAAILPTIDTPYAKAITTVQYQPTSSTASHPTYIGDWPCISLPEVRTYTNLYHVPSGELYDTKGRPHIWVMGTCIVCADTLSNVAGTNIDETIYNFGIAESFYNTFAINCPEGGQHDRTPCTKCKMGDEYSVAIIHKYKAVYTELMCTHILPIQLPAPVSAHCPTWTYNRAIFSEFEKLYKVPMARVKNIGLVCGILLRSIECGESNPCTNAANHRTQGNVVFQYATILGNLYGKLRHTDIDANSAIKTIANKYSDDVGLLPDLPVVAYCEYSALGDTDYANFMLFYFFSTLIWLNKPGLMCEFGRYFVRYIFEYDALFSKTDLQLAEYAQPDYGLPADPDIEDMDDDLDLGDSIKYNIGFRD